MLESYLPHPEAITDEQVSLFLKLLFHKDSTRQLMEKVFAGNGNFQGEDAGRKTAMIAFRPQPVNCPSERMQYTPPEGSGLRPAGNFLRKADDCPQRSDSCQSSQGKLHFPCAGCCRQLPLWTCRRKHLALQAVPFSKFKTHS